MHPTKTIRIRKERKGKWSADVYENGVLLWKSWQDNFPSKKKLVECCQDIAPNVVIKEN
jgi:hypothetical protein